MKDLNARLRAAGLLAAAGSLLLIGLPSFAADAPAATPAKADAKKVDEKKDEAKEPVEQIIVTGSRIRHDAFTSDSPIQVITKEESVLAGLVTTTETLQGSTVSGGSGQINNYFGGYVTDGGPGANTLSLRGLGAVRTLILLNGRRLAPSGTRGSVGSADLNVLPSSMVDRIEILKDGASSIYGSDAVAGVVNIITRKGIKDFTLEATQMNTWDQGGNQTTVSGTWGHVGDRYEISGSLEMYARSNLTVGQRDWAQCSTAAFIDPTDGSYAAGSVIDPVTGKPKCNPVGGGAGTTGIANNYIGAFLQDANGNYQPYNRWTPDSAATAPVPGWRQVQALGKRNGNPASLMYDSLISPTRNYTFFLNGSYDLQALGNAEAYFELLWTHRDSAQVGSRQVILDYQYDASNGFAGHPFVPQILTDRGADVGFGNPLGDEIEARAFIANGNDTSKQSALFTRFVGGLRGDLPFGRDWKYDTNVQLSRSNASYTFMSYLTDRIYDSLYVAPVVGSTTLPTRTVGGVTYQCASGNPGCVPAPELTADLLAGNIDPTWRNYAFRPVTGHTVFDEAIFSATADGSLFALPAGDARGAVGVEARTLKLDDTPGQDMINQNLYGFTSSGITRGKDAVREAFGEIELPLLRGKFFAENLSIDLSGRLTQYNSYGSDRTYKAGFNYAPFSWLKFRGTKGSSFRAPGLFEQYLSPTSGFVNQSNDPCNDYGQKNPTSAIYINCASEGLPVDFSATNSIQVNSAGGAALGLKSENSHADTLGVVVQPAFPASVGDFAVAVDWWRIVIGNQVAQVGGVNLLNLCYNDPQFRAGGSYCAYSTRDPNDNSLLVQDNYINIATQVAEGVDYNVRYAHDVGLGRLTVDLRATRYLRQDSRLLPTDPLDKFNGTLTSPKWVGDGEVIYKWKDWAFRYGLTYVDSMDSNKYLGVDPTVDPFNFTVGRYTEQSISAKYTSPAKWSAQLGVRNFTNEQPKTTGAGYYDRVGNVLLYSGYDYFGRRVYLSLSKSL
jgi:outer membrane receptor protein involved in Fe transport